MKDKRKSTKKMFSKLVTIICIGVFAFAAHGLFDIFMDYYQNRKMMSNVQDTFYNAVSAEEGTQQEGDDGSKTIRPGFEELLKHNPDVVGWITIDGTQIDYPILQSSNNQTYLTKNYNNNESRAGSIFLDYRNDVGIDELNTVVYGHRMKDGSMFQHLTKFLDKDFFDEHRTFEVDTLYDSYEAEIFAVYNTLTDFNYIETDFANEAEYEQLLKDIQDVSKFKTDVDITPDDRIITLSTCDYELDQNEGRLVIQAKLVEK
ncbi:class B sortase [Virgibacillus sp. MSJ-26]|uniref:class B sortase n=1 Tax=Virgibacillus sp. MSJ-26 TaxID=2841522 RepID=UPI001C116335|nr:class B sortase [Virgibacillus sp. MSJ-26]MBU5467574.1 class B sortase [Virgibacillus sp. MSJ-26]